MRKRRRWRNIQYFLALYLVALTFGNLKRAKGAEAQQNGTTNRARGLKSIGNNNNGNNHYNPHYLDEKLRKVRDVDEMRLKRIEKRDQLEKSSEIVNKAVEEAKAASEAQGMAAQQAAHQVKSQLADRAIRAAKAAEAALSGKIALLEQLGEETKEAQIVFQDGSLELEQIRKSTNAAIRVARDSRQQYKTLSRSLSTLTKNVEVSEEASQGARRELIEQEQLVNDARRRLHELTKRTRQAKRDLENTKIAVMKANAAARLAQENAARIKSRFASFDKSQ
ncbi:GSCOCG00000124001-RA-CDS [Cotesia congregata]|nr:GSCOCG00000124001-RA-CDS [Cotesia congregata]